MTQGKNSEVIHKGLRYHVQTQLTQTESNTFISQVFLKGQVVYEKKHKALGNYKTQVEAERKAELLHISVIKDIKEMMI